MVGEAGFHLLVDAKPLTGVWLLMLGIGLIWAGRANKRGGTNA